MIRDNKCLISVFFIFLFLHYAGKLYPQEIERFEHINTENGLSQNSVLSIYCNRKGFMWFGTMDGLNRFDGFDFKIYKAQPGKNNVLSNSRIIKIREDGKDFLWVQTYDGYYHYLNKTKDQFIPVRKKKKTA